MEFQKFLDSRIIINKYGEGSMYKKGDLYYHGFPEGSSKEGVFIPLYINNPAHDKMKKQIKTSIIKRNGKELGEKISKIMMPEIKITDEKFEENVKQHCVNFKVVDGNFFCQGHKVDEVETINNEQFGEETPTLRIMNQRPKYTDTKCKKQKKVNGDQRTCYSLFKKITSGDFMVDDGTIKIISDCDLQDMGYVMGKNID